MTHASKSAALTDRAAQGEQITLDYLVSMNDRLLLALREISYYASPCGRPSCECNACKIANIAEIALEGEGTQQP